MYDAGGAYVFSQDKGAIMLKLKSAMNALHMLVLGALVFVTVSSNKVSATTIGEGDCLLGCSLGGSFAPHPTAAFAAAGVMQARVDFTLPNVGDRFYALTGVLPFFAEFSVVNTDTGNGNVANYAPAGTQIGLLLERAPAQSASFSLLVDALLPSGYSSGFTVTASSQPMDDVLIAQALQGLGLDAAGTSSVDDLRLLYGLGSTAGSAEIYAAFKASENLGVAPIPWTMVMYLSGLWAALMMLHAGFRAWNTRMLYLAVGAIMHPRLAVQMATDAAYRLQSYQRRVQG